MFEVLNNIGWWFSIVAVIGALIFYVYEKYNEED